MCVKILLTQGLGEYAGYLQWAVRRRVEHCPRRSMWDCDLSTLIFSP